MPNPLTSNGWLLSGKELTRMDKISEEMRCIHDHVTDTLYVCVTDLIDFMRDTADRLAAHGMEGEAAGVASIGLGLLNGYEEYFHNPVNQMVIEFLRNQN